MNIEIRGIAPNQVQSAPEWVDLYRAVNELVASDIVVT